MEAGEVEEWLSARCFDADAAEDLDDVGVEEWLSARCFDADAAEDLDDVGITPSMASTRTKAGSGSYLDTVGYKVAVGDLGLEEACELLGVHVAGRGR